ncbi:hypothetical protein ACA910_000885 [Epithemia clementina (nom. ined.)]
MKSNDDGNKKNEGRSRILFGSCNSQYRDQQLWSAILARNATAFIWGGDAVYADSKIRGQEIAATPEILAQSFRAQLNQTGYQQLIMEPNNMTVVGVWDDHDYGINNGDRDYPYKKESAALFVDFLEQSSHRPWTLLSKRAKEEKGVYGVVVFDFTKEEPLLSDEEAGIDPDVLTQEQTTTPPARLSQKSVAVFLLDVRYNKTPWGPGYQNYDGDFEGDFLGEEQWQWFEAALARSTARVNIIVSGLQVHPDRWFDGNLIEDWGGFPMAQHRLYQNLLRPNVQAPMIVSGDVHMAEFLRRDCKRPNDLDGPYRSLVEVTTSGMTHSWGTFNCPRVRNSIACRSPFIQFMSALSMHFAHLNHGWRDLIDYRGPRFEGAKRRIQYSLDINFGEFEFDWDKEQVTVRILGSDNDKPPQLSMVWDFETLSTASDPTGKLSSADFQRRFATMARQSNVPQGSDWICLPNQGPMPAPVKVYGTLGAAVMGVSTCCAPFLLVPVLAVMYFYRNKKSKLD